MIEFDPDGSKTPVDPTPQFVELFYKNNLFEPVRFGKPGDRALWIKDADEDDNDHLSPTDQGKISESLIKTQLGKDGILVTCIGDIYGSFISAAILAREKLDNALTRNPKSPITKIATFVDFAVQFPAPEFTDELAKFHAPSIAFGKYQPDLVRIIVEIKNGKYYVTWNVIECKYTTMGSDDDDVVMYENWMVQLMFYHWAVDSTMHTILGGNIPAPSLNGFESFTRDNIIEVWVSRKHLEPENRRSLRVQASQHTEVAKKWIFNDIPGTVLGLITQEDWAKWEQSKKAKQQKGEIK